jgi:hypothetical protein
MSQELAFERRILQIGMMVRRNGGGARRAPGEKIGEVRGDHNTVHNIVAPQGPITIVNQSPPRPSSLPAGSREAAQAHSRAWAEALIADIRKHAETLEIDEVGLLAIATRELRERLVVLKLESLEEDDLLRVWDVVRTLRRPALE